LWQLTVALHDRQKGQPLKVLRWSLTQRRRGETIRDRILRGVGTDEPLIEEDYMEFARAVGFEPSAGNWRKPLSIEEINRMAPTDDVRARPGRP